MQCDKLYSIYNFCKEYLFFFCITFLWLHKWATTWHIECWNKKQWKVVKITNKSKSVPFLHSHFKNLDAALCINAQDSSLISSWSIAFHETIEQCDHWLVSVGRIRCLQSSFEKLTSYCFAPLGEGGGNLISDSSSLPSHEVSSGWDLNKMMPYCEVTNFFSASRHAELD